MCGTPSPSDGITGALGNGGSRRGFLRGAAGLTAVGLIPGVVGCGAEDDGGDDGVIEVAIVGAGLGGTHCAYRLAQAGADVVLFEATGRAGGRTFTSRDGHPDGQLCELGGELVDSNHATMWCLAEELGITLDDRTDLGAGVSTGDTWWVNGAAVSDDVIVQQFVAVAPAFADAVVAADSDDVAYETLDLTTLSDWLDENCPPAQYPELHAVITAAYVGEFGRETAEQSSLNMLYLIGSDEPDPFRIFGESDERWHAHEGSAAFAERMAAAIDPVRIRLDHVLLAVRLVDDHHELRFSGPPGEVVVRARKVVLALPWTILRDVDLTESGISDEKIALIDTLGYGANSKLMGWFTTPVWRTQYMASGSFTRDDDAQQGWDTSIGQDGTHGIVTGFVSANAAEALTASNAVSWFENVTLPALDEMWPGCSAAFVPGSVVQMLWPTATYAKGSYTCYLPGQWATWATEGEREGNIHFCGEHCSADFQGWMEGAAETGGLVAAVLLDELGLPIPEGLQCVLDAKLVVEQPAFGRLSARPRWRARRRALRHAALALHASRGRVRQVQPPSDDA